VAAAEREAGRVAARLTQLGLDLIRDVRQSYADVLLAHGRVAVAEEAVRLRGEIARLAEAHLAAVDRVVEALPPRLAEGIQQHLGHVLQAGGAVEVDQECLHREHGGSVPAPRGL